MDYPSLSELYLRAKNTGIGAPNIPWCGKKIVFDNNYKSNEEYLNIDIKKTKNENKKLKNENKKLKKYCKQLLEEINNSKKLLQKDKFKNLRMLLS